MSGLEPSGPNRHCAGILLARPAGLPTESAIRAQARGACQKAQSARKIGDSLPSFATCRVAVSPNARAWLASLALVGALLASSDAAHAEPPQEEPASDAARPCRSEPSRRALAVGASIVPGVIVHGSGHWVLCEPETARRLVYLEAAGAGSVLLSGTGLALTGASRYVVAPLALGALGGLALFATTWLADIYGVAAPAGGSGQPRARTETLILQAGVRAVHDPLFDTGWLISQGLLVNPGPLWLAPRFDASPDGSHVRYGFRAGRRILGAHLDPTRHARWGIDGVVGVRDFTEQNEGFGITTLEVALSGRLDLVAIGPSLEGAFGFAEAGYAREWHRFDGAPGHTWDALLGRFGFGMYLGHGPDVRGETWVAYDHRRDTVAGGLRVPGIPAGYAGFLEHRTELYFDRHFGAALELAYGSAAVASVYWLVRFPRGGW